MKGRSPFGQWPVQVVRNLHRLVVTVPMPDISTRVRLRGPRDVEHFSYVPLFFGCAGRISQRTKSFFTNDFVVSGSQPCFSDIHPCKVPISFSYPCSWDVHLSTVMLHVYQSSQINTESLGPPSHLVMRLCLWSLLDFLYPF